MDTLIKNLSAVLFDEVAIRTRIKELGFELSREYNGKNPILICILKGSIFFLSDLVRYMTIPIEIDFLSISSYGDSTKSSGIVKIRKDIDFDISGRHVIVIEDIIDSGLSLHYITKYLENQHPASVATCVLIDKKCKRKVEIDVNYIGFEVEDDFIVGYGLDYAEQYRNLPYIGILKKEVYS